VALVSGAVALAGCGGSDAETASEPQAVASVGAERRTSAGAGRASAGGGLSLRMIGRFDQPVFVASAPGARGLLFVVEQPGRVRVLRRGRPLAKPFLDLTDRVQAGGEEGLLSIAFDPRYRKNRRFFAYYTNRNGDIEVDSFRRKRSSATRASERSRRKVIVVPHPVNANHNGGQLQFGPDRLLYLGTGDGGAAGDPEENAQNPESLLGKLLRIAPRRNPGRGGYTIPKDNPFFGERGGREEIYALGLRNPYRFSFDAETGEISIGDVGQSEVEELDHLGLAAARGANFGWDVFEGSRPFEGETPPANYVGPVHEYSSGEPNCSVIAGYVVRDPGLPSLTGRLLYADFCAEEIRSVDPGASNPSSTDASTGLRLDLVSSFGEGARNRIYVASLDGPVMRLVQE
jgi:glucose/arabinose dehydrogenase